MTLIRVATILMQLNMIAVLLSFRKNKKIQTHNYLSSGFISKLRKMGRLLELNSLKNFKLDFSHFLDKKL
jgi:hypothetical protein